MKTWKFNATVNVSAVTSIVTPDDVTEAEAREMVLSRTNVELSDHSYGMADEFGSWLVFEADGSPTELALSDVRTASKMDIDLASAHPDENPGVTEDWEEE